MPETLEDLLAAELRKRQAWAWQEGFIAGQQYGQQRERYDPNRDDEPEKTRNPYKPAEGGV